MDDITEQERQLIEIIREQSNGEFRLTIERQGGAWEIALAVFPIDSRDKSRGTGATVAGADELPKLFPARHGKRRRPRLSAR